MTIRTPDDWHVHLRDGRMLATVAPFTASVFRYALVMPNLVPPITSAAGAAAYRERVMAASAARANPDFEPLMALYLNDEVAVEDLVSGHRDGIVFAAKYYPAGATTNSEAGSDSLQSLLPTLERMSEAGIPLLVHAESTDPDVDVFDRERAFLERELGPVCDELPDLLVTVEHVSTAAGVAFVREHPRVGGSITPHHLSCDRDDILADGLRPHLYCKPVLNSADDRRALVEAATGEDASFFLGTDSAPHPESSKHSDIARPGIFSAPHALPIVADVFESVGKLDRLEAFVSLNGAAHYGMDGATSSLTLRRRPEGADSSTSEGWVPAGESRVKIFGVSAAARWTLDRNGGAQG